MGLVYIGIPSVSNGYMGVCGKIVAKKIMSEMLLNVTMFCF